MKIYDIKFINNNEKCIVFSNSYRFTLDVLKNIEIELKELLDQKTEIIFDLLLCNGNSKDRFAKIYYTENGLDFKSFEFINIPKKDDLRKISANYYKNKDFLDNSILTSVQKDMIRKGMVI